MNAHFKRHSTCSVFSPGWARLRTCLDPIYFFQDAGGVGVASNPLPRVVGSASPSSKISADGHAAATASSLVWLPSQVEPVVLDQPPYPAVGVIGHSAGSAGRRLAMAAVSAGFVAKTSSGPSTSAADAMPARQAESSRTVHILVLFWFILCMMAHTFAQVIARPLFCGTMGKGSARGENEG